MVIGTGTMGYKECYLHSTRPLEHMADSDLNDAENSKQTAGTGRANRGGIDTGSKAPGDLGKAVPNSAGLDSEEEKDTVKDSKLLAADPDTKSDSDDDKAGEKHMIHQLMEQ